MPENSLEVTITLSDSYLNDDELQEVVEGVKAELAQVEGVQQTDLIPIENAPQGAKSLGGYIFGQLKALIDRKKFTTIITWLQKNLPGKTIKVKAKDNNKGKELEIEISRPEDLAKVMAEVNKFMDN